MRRERRDKSVSGGPDLMSSVCERLYYHWSAFSVHFTHSINALPSLTHIDAQFVKMKTLEHLVDPLIPSRKPLNMIPEGFEKVGYEGFFMQNFA